jgi:predicted HicB family RNase H-like nuclease
MDLPHGGRREGAGRPPEGEEAKQKTSIAVNPKLLRAAERAAQSLGISRNKFIEDAIRTALAALGPQEDNQP